MKAFWDELFAEASFAYGEEPNDFLRDMTHAFAPNSRVLLLAEGQGRNAVWLARHGHAAVAVDQSEVGLERARELAAKHGVTIETVAADLSVWDAPEGSFDAVVGIFAHLPPEGRARMHAMAVRALRSGGIAVVELYSPRQLQHKTGGPPVIEFLVEPERLREEFKGLLVERCEEVEREVIEGSYHTGRAATVQLFGRKP